MSGYVVGTIHPTARRRQWPQLEEGDVADIADALVHLLAVELRRRNVAGSERVGEWTLAEQIRETIARHHEQAFKRWLADRLEG